MTHLRRPCDRERDRRPRLRERLPCARHTVARSLSHVHATHTHARTHLLLLDPLELLLRRLLLLALGGIHSGPPSVKSAGRSVFSLTREYTFHR